MKPTSDHEDNIDRYLRQEMSSEEQTAFERALREDEALRQEVALHQDVTAGIAGFGGARLKSQLKAVDAQEAAAPSRSGKGRPLYVWLGVAASLALFLLAAILLLGDKTDPQSLYLTYYEPYPNIVNPVERSEGVPTDAAGQALYYYERGDYDRAIELFGSLSSLDDQAYRFYLAVSYLAVENAESARATLQPLVEDEQGVFYEPGLWYLGLAQLLANQTEAARDTFRKVAALQGEYQAEAEVLLDEL